MKSLFRHTLAQVFFSEALLSIGINVLIWFLSSASSSSATTACRGAQLATTSHFSILLDRPSSGRLRGGNMEGP